MNHPLGSQLIQYRRFFRPMMNGVKESAIYTVENALVYLIPVGSGLDASQVV